MESTDFAIRAYSRVLWRRRPE